jgi:hypothetical protein
MSAKLTRRALYELVWSKPATHLAKDLGISAAWIGKQCRALNVPAPARATGLLGYWASMAAAGKPKARYLRHPLTYTVAEKIQVDHDKAAPGLEGFDLANFEQAVPSPPTVTDTLEEAVARYARLARAQTSRRRTAGWHPVALRLLAEDERRAAQASPYPWDQPAYRGITVRRS